MNVGAGLNSADSYQNRIDRKAVKGIVFYAIHRFLFLSISPYPTNSQNTLDNEVKVRYHVINVQLTRKGVKMKESRYNGILSKEAFLSLICQQSIIVGYVDARWVSVIWSCSKKTAITIMDDLEKQGKVKKDTNGWRSNAVKFEWTPTDETLGKYRKGDFRDGYKRYMAGLFEAMG